MNKFSKDRINDIRQNLNMKYKYNLFEHLIELLKSSKFIYGIKLTQGTGKIKNLNRQEDDRFTKMGKKKSKIFLPPNGLDTYIEIDIDPTYVDFETQMKTVNIINIIFHELFEAYMMVNVGLQYQEAHNYVGVQEKILDQQFPGLTQCFAYEKLLKTDIKNTNLTTIV